MTDLDKEIYSSRKKAEYIKNNYYIFFKSIIKKIPIFTFLEKRYEFKGEILELGAGSCWFSSQLSILPKVKKIYALDISKDIFTKVARKVVQDLNGDNKKIDFIISDFHRIPFHNNKFDIIICDASLHHSQDLLALLNEIKRVLKNEGFFIAIQEPIKSIPHLLRLRGFGRKERESGATENILSKKEWKSYFSQVGLKLCIHEEFNKNDFKTKIFEKSILKIFNGIIFSRYYFIAKK